VRTVRIHGFVKMVWRWYKWHKYTSSWPRNLF